MPKQKPKAGNYRRLQPADEQARPMHPKKAAVVRRALQVYQCSKDKGKWARIATSESRNYLHVQAYRMRTKQGYAWDRFGRWETKVEYLPYKRSETGRRGMYVLLVRYPDVGLWPRPDLEQAVVEELMRAEQPVLDTTTPEEWARWKAVQQAREAAEERANQAAWG